MTEHSTALAPVDADGVIIELPTPVFSGAQIVQALVAYRELQAALDQSMPDCIQRIGDKDFRKKEYWDAVALAFSLDVEVVEERREIAGEFDDGRPNFGYLFIVRATSKTGRAVVGDGTCFAVEKAARFRCPHHSDPNRPTWSDHYPTESCPDFDPAYVWAFLPAQASEHNVRAHAMTRARNRAVSTAVGFGEVSFEELGGDAVERPEPRPRPAPDLRHAGNTPPRQSQQTRAPMPISEAQVRRLWVIGKQSGWTETEIKSLYGRHGFEHVESITRDKYDRIIADLEAGVDGTRGQS